MQIVAPRPVKFVSAGTSDEQAAKTHSNWRQQMCLSTSALLLFISMLPKEIVDPGPDQIAIAADTGTVKWESFEDVWCTVAPLKRTAIEEAAK